MDTDEARQLLLAERERLETLRAAQGDAVADQQGGSAHAGERRSSSQLTANRATATAGSTT